MVKYLKPRKVANVVIDSDLLAALLQLPDGVEVVRLFDDPQQHQFVIRVQGDGLPDDCVVSDGCLVRNLTGVVYQRVDDVDGKPVVRIEWR
jgi:hypothetical protein